MSRFGDRQGTTYLRQPEKNTRRLNELASEDAEVGLRAQVEAVEHRRRRGEPLLRDERVVDRQVDLRVDFVSDEDPIVVGGRVGGNGERSRSHVRSRKGRVTTAVDSRRKALNRPRRNGPARLSRGVTSLAFYRPLYSTHPRRNCGTRTCSYFPLADKPKKHTFAYFLLIDISPEFVGSHQHEFDRSK